MIRTLPILQSGQRLSASDAAKIFLHTSHLTSVFLRSSSLIFSFILFPPTAKLQTFQPWQEYFTILLSFVRSVYRMMTHFCGEMSCEAGQWPEWQSGGC
jgi:hypothetical protein